MNLLQPGIYVGVRKVTLGHLMPIPGWHEFRVLIPRDPNRFADKVTNIGGGNRGIVVGAYRMGSLFNKQLRYQRNADKEISAIREYFARQKDPQQPEFFRTKLKRASHQGRDTDSTIDMFLSLAQTYRKAARKNPVEYPGAITNVLGEAPNSNTFIQSLLDVGGIRKRPDLDVFTPGETLRLPTQLFGKTSAFLDGYLMKTAGPVRPGYTRKHMEAQNAEPGPIETLPVDLQQRYHPMLNR